MEKSKEVDMGKFLENGMMMRFSKKDNKECLTIIHSGGEIDVIMNIKDEKSIDELIRFVEEVKRNRG